LTDSENSLSDGGKDEDLIACPRQAPGYPIRQEARSRRSDINPTRSLESKIYIDEKL